ncbi:MAG: helix-turn-helix domain-containing protein [bacterium]
MTGFSKKDESPAVVSGPGALLAQSRKAKGLTVQQAANMLHLTVETVESLELDDYEGLPARVFIRGYVKNFARLVELPESQVLQRFDDLCPDQECSNALPSVKSNVKAEVRSNHGIVKLVTWLIVISILAGLIISLKDHVSRVWDDLQNSSILKQEETQPDNGELLLPALPVSAVSSEEPLPVDGEEIKETRPEEVPLTEASKPATITVHFTGPTWIDIKDSAQTFHLSGDMESGTSQELGGEPPYTIMLSNYQQVSFTIDGEPYDLTPHIEAEGTPERLNLRFELTGN